MRRYNPKPISKMETIRGCNLILERYDPKDAHRVMVEAFKVDSARKLARRMAALDKKGDKCQHRSSAQIGMTGSSSGG
jgi:hypothetical protein